MKAAVWHGEKDIRVEEKELKALKDNEVTVRVAWAGICGSDLHGRACIHSCERAR